jgi:hypothetical protein
MRAFFPLVGRFSMKVILMSAAVVTTGFLCSCGGGQPEPGQESNAVQLVIADSIGIELGDTNYVFGSLMSLEAGPDGLIYALDRARGCVMVYDSTGAFVRQIGSQGNGPGEMMNPLSMAVLGDGRITVNAAYNGGMYNYLPDGTWQGLSAEFTNNPPMQMEGADSNAYVALKLDVLPDESGGISVSVRIGRYEESIEPMVEYFENSFPFDPQNLTALLRASYFGYAFTAARDGRVAIAERSSSIYSVKVYSAEGTELFTLTGEPVQVAKSEEEIAGEKAFVEGLLQSMGASGVVISYVPDPWREQITGVGFDGRGRIWVQRGIGQMPTFDVWGADGTLLFTAEVPGAGADGMSWEVEYGTDAMYAFSMDPASFQQIFVIPMPE